jgi:hypothetical protein
VPDSVSKWFLTGRLRGGWVGVGADPVSRRKMTANFFFFFFDDDLLFLES